MLKKIFFAFFVRPLVLVVSGVHVKGKEKLVIDGPCIIAANHNSHLDTMVLMSLFPLAHINKVRPVGAADYFMKNKWFTWFSREFIGIIPLKRRPTKEEGHPLLGVKNALNNGVALKARVQFRLIVDRGWWFNKEVTLHTINYQLKYHALSQHYLLTRNDTNENWNFSNLSAALRKLGELRQYPLPNIQKSMGSNDYSILAVADMSPETLRLPLRIQSLFSDKYSIASEGVLWPLP